MNLKWYSRKFTVFALWSLLTAVAVFSKVETLTLNIGDIIQYYFFISVTYMGANALSNAVHEGLLNKKK